MKKHIISVMLIAGTVALCGCSANNGTSSDIQSSSQSESQQTAEAATSKVETAEAPAESSVLADLTGTYDDVSEKFEFSDGWSNGSMFNCTWRKSNGSIFDGSMKLTIDKDLLDKPPYSGAEFRSRDFYGYGMYEVVMKPINIPSNPGKIMMNVWPGTGVDGWLNAFDGTVPLTAEYKSVDFAAAEEG